MDGRGFLSRSWPPSVGPSGDYERETRRDGRGLLWVREARTGKVNAWSLTCLE